MPESEALAFDMYGTLVDPIRIGEQLERRLPDEASRVAEVWRHADPPLQRHVTEARAGIARVRRQPG